MLSFLLNRLTTGTKHWGNRREAESSLAVNSSKPWCPWLKAQRRRPAGHKDGGGVGAERRLCGGRMAAAATGHKAGSGGMMHGTRPAATGPSREGKARGGGRRHNGGGRRRGQGQGRGLPGRRRLGFRRRARW